MAALSFTTVATQPIVKTDCVTLCAALSFDNQLTTNTLVPDLMAFTTPLAGRVKAVYALQATKFLENPQLTQGREWSVGGLLNLHVRLQRRVYAPTFPEANMAAFAKSMEDGEKVEQWQQTLALYFGEVQGAPTPGWLELHPMQTSP